MAKKFFLNGQEVDVEISPILVETLDESLDNLTVSLKANKRKTAYEPMGIFELKENNQVIHSFIVSADNVELYTQNPLRYRHTLTLTQNSQKLSKHIIRNTVFSTLIDSMKTTFTASSTVLSLFERPLGAGVDWYEFSYVNVSNSSVIASIDLAEIKMSNIMMTVNFKAQVGQQFVDIGDGVRTRIAARQITLNKWPDLWKDTTSDDGDYLPTIIFDINGTQRELTLNSSEIENGQKLELSSDILEWIKSYNSGILTISIKNAPNSSVFFNGDAWSRVYDHGTYILDNEVPILVNFNVLFDFTQEEESVYTVIDTLRKQQLKETADYNTSNDSSLVPLFKMPDADHYPELEQLLKETISPNFIFTQASLFDALSEIFRLYDATFRIDEEGYLNIEYFNEHELIELDDDKKSGRASSLGEERYANRLTTFFQNTKINDRFPNSNNEKTLAYIRSKTTGIPGESDYVFMTPKPIDIINKAYIYVPSSLVTTFYYQGCYYIFYYGQNAQMDSAIDITDNIVEESLWSVLPVNSNNAFLLQNRSKYNCFQYKRGTNYIDISGYWKAPDNFKNSVVQNVCRNAFYRQWGIGDPNGYIPLFSVTIPNMTDIKMAVEYIALVDGRLQIESIDNKYDGEILTNQDNGSIDINKLGLNMVGLSLKLGQPTLTMTHKFSNWNDRIRKGQYFMDGNEKWVANTCSYKLIRDDLVETTIEFVKNFNALASRIELNREKRLTNISNELTVKCEENYGEFIYYSSKSINEIGGNVPEKISLKPETWRNAIAMTFGKKLPSLLTGEIDFTSRVITYSTYLEFYLATNTRKELISIGGWLANDPEENGYLAINENSSLTGTTFYIPLSSASKSIFKLNEITDEVDVDFDVFGDFLTNENTSGYERGDRIDLYILRDGQTIICAAVESILEPPENAFEPSTMWTYIPENTDRIEYALLTAYDKNENVVINESRKIKNIAIPLVVYGSGNAVCFETSFDSPISAGMQLLPNSPLWMGGWFSSHVLYTDINGSATKFTVDYIKLREETTRAFPEMYDYDNSRYLEAYSFGKIDRLCYYKKPNEIFALNYQLNFLPIEDEINKIFVSNEFIKNNGFANGLNKQEFFVYYSTNDDDIYDILDTKGKGTKVPLNELSFFFTNVNQKYQEVRVTIEIQDAPQGLADQIKSWAICDKNNNIYISCNGKANEGTGDEFYFTFTFFSRHHRLH